MARAALACGADGLLVEVHPAPEEALSDGPQALTTSGFIDLMADLNRWIPLTGRAVAEPPMNGETPHAAEPAKARAT